LCESDETSDDCMGASPQEGSRGLLTSSLKLRDFARRTVKVVHRHSAISFDKAELWSVLLGASPIAHEHLLDLLGDDDGHHSGCGGLVDVFAYVVDLAVIPAGSIGSVQMKEWDAIDLSEAADRIAEAITNLLEQRGRGDGVAEVLGQEGDHLPADLQLWDIAVEVDTIQAVEVQDDMTFEHIIDVE